MNEIKPHTNQLSKNKFVCDDDGYEQSQLCSLSLVVLTQCSKFVFDRYEQTIMSSSLVVLRQCSRGLSFSVDGSKLWQIPVTRRVNNAFIMSIGLVVILYQMSGENYSI